MINLELALKHNLSKQTIKDLNALHGIMSDLVSYYKQEEGWYWPRHERKAFAKRIRRLEYMMQEKWGFDRDKGRHMHWGRFKGLYARTVDRTMGSYDESR